MNISAAAGKAEGATRVGYPTLVASSDKEEISGGSKTLTRLVLCPTTKPLRQDVEFRRTEIFGFRHPLALA